MQVGGAPIAVRLVRTTPPRLTLGAGEAVGAAGLGTAVVEGVAAAGATVAGAAGAAVAGAWGAEVGVEGAAHAGSTIDTTIRDRRTR
jgi:hypothetical protein